MRVSIRLYLQTLRGLSVIAATCYFGTTTAFADCIAQDAKAPLAITLPVTTISASPDLPLGATLGSAHVAAPQDISFACSGSPNSREARLASTATPVTGFAGVYTTNVPGVGMRLTVQGGSFAGIDDGPRLAPYTIALTPAAKHLTGFALQIDFIKIGPVQNGTLAASKLLTVLAGGAELIDVAIPSGAVVFAANQCDAAHVGGAVGTSIGTGGAFTYESLAVSTGCNPAIGVMVELNQGYIYGSGPPVTSQNLNRKLAAVSGSVGVNRVSRKFPTLDSTDATETNTESSAFGAATSGTTSSGNAFGTSSLSGNSFDSAGRAAGFRH